MDFTATLWSKVSTFAGCAARGSIVVTAMAKATNGLISKSPSGDSRMATVNSRQSAVESFSSQRAVQPATMQSGLTTAD